MKRILHAHRITAAVDELEHAVALVVIRMIGILGAMTVLSVALYEWIKFATFVWLQPH